MAIIHRARTLGVNPIDTAEVYAYGYSEVVAENLGVLLRDPIASGPL